MRRSGILALAVLMAAPAPAEVPPPEPGAFRIAQYNAALSRRGAGVLLGAIRDRDDQVLDVAEVILRARPDVLVLNEIDRDPGGAALDAFAALLAKGVRGLDGLDYRHRLQPISNTGRPSGLDIDGDGQALGPTDAWGYGVFPGQYALAVLSRYPLTNPRTWARFAWSALPGAQRPMLPEGAPLHDDTTWAALRLSSKTHLAVEVALPTGPLSLIAAHPTPPVFDGPADRNGARNDDEIRLISALIAGADWLVDDDGAPGGIGPGPFVAAGDLNADPADGAARRTALTALLASPLIQDPEPRSAGGAQAAARDGEANRTHRGDPALDTADWRDDPGPGNLRVDYVLPSSDLTVTGAGVFWPAEGTPGAEAATGSDHRLVWVDIVLP
ncbi:MAG: endonuclease/exonuclease/phosphatase family protein [Pseudomonadota bacterium]